MEIIFFQTLCNSYVSVIKNEGHKFSWLNEAVVYEWDVA